MKCSESALWIKNIIVVSKAMFFSTFSNDAFLEISQLTEMRCSIKRLCSIREEKNKSHDQCDFPFGKKCRSNSFHWNSRRHAMASACFWIGLLLFNFRTWSFFRLKHLVAQVFLIFVRLWSSLCGLSTHHAEAHHAGGLHRIDCESFINLIGMSTMNEQSSSHVSVRWFEMGCSEPLVPRLSEDASQDFPPFHSKTRSIRATDTSLFFPKKELCSFCY